MNDLSDQQLLRKYSESRSEPAFAELVRRHIDLVYSAALRRIGDTHQAQDVTQGTFLALAQSASQLKHHPVLSGWLHRTTQNIAANLIRTNSRRQAREHEAVTMNELLSAAPDASWETIAPQLDAALDELDASDRDAVVLRFFEKKSTREMAAQLGISDDAAQKRVSRAVERLREFFAKRGISVGASGLAVVISANAVQAAPVGLALTISSAAALTATTLATTATAAATKAIAMTALQKTIVTTTIAALAGVGIYEARQASQLRDQVQTLQQQQAPMAQQIEQLLREREPAANRSPEAAAQIDQWKSGQNLAELLKLRGQVGVLAADARANSPAKVMAGMVNDPAQKELARMQIQQALHTRYDPLVQKLNLPDETAARIGDLIIQNELSKKDRLAALMKGELDVESASLDRDNAKNELERQIAETLGESAYAQFKQFNRDADAQAFVKIISDQMGQNSLNPEQRLNLQNLVADQPGVTVDDIDLFRSKESLDSIYQEQFARAQTLLQQAAGFLTPEQSTAVGRIHTSYWNEVKTKMALYQQLIENTMRSNSR